MRYAYDMFIVTFSLTFTVTNAFCATLSTGCERVIGAPFEAPCSLPSGGNS